MISALLSDFRKRPSGRICARSFRRIRPSGRSIERRMLREIRNPRKKFMSEVVFGGRLWRPFFGTTQNRRIAPKRAIFPSQRGDLLILAPSNGGQEWPFRQSLGGSRNSGIPDLTPSRLERTSTSLDPTGPIGACVHPPSITIQGHPCTDRRCPPSPGPSLRACNAPATHPPESPSRSLRLGRSFESTRAPSGRPTRRGPGDRPSGDRIEPSPPCAESEGSRPDGSRCLRCRR